MTSLTIPSNTARRNKLTVAAISATMVLAATTPARASAGMMPSENTVAITQTTTKAPAKAAPKKYRAAKEDPNKKVTALIMQVRQATAWTDLDVSGLLSDTQVFDVSTDIVGLITEDVANTLRHFSYAVFKQYTSGHRAEWKLLMNIGDTRHPVWVIADDLPEHWEKNGAHMVPQGVPVLEKLLVAKADDSSTGFPLTDLAIWHAAHQPQKQPAPRSRGNPHGRSHA